MTRRASPSAFSLHAWVDESLRFDGADGTGIYILAAVVCDPSACDTPRDQLRSLRLRGQERLHWRDEDDGRRTRLTAAVAGIDLAGVVIVGTPVQPSKQERARRHCLTRLLHELEQVGVTNVWLEARNPSLNARDREMVEALRGQRVISPAIRIDIARPLEEPMLWASDVIAGAANAARGGNSVWRDAFAQQIHEIEIDIR